MQYLPLFFELRGKRCLVIGGGNIALRKARLLHKAGGILHVVAPSILAELKQLVSDSSGLYRAGEYTSLDLDDMSLVIAATDNKLLNKQVSDEAHLINIPVNVVDCPELCSFILPAIIDRSPLMIAVSSGGQSPVLARLVRSKIETIIPSAYGRLAKLVGKFRKVVQEKYTSLDERRNFWEETLQGPLAEMVFAGKDKVAETMLEDILDSTIPPAPSGEVYLVGAGPGDPDLLTFKALRLMQKADVVLYDRLVADEIIELTRKDAERIYVGKARADHAVPQQDINQLLVELALQGKKVVRLKGGDPFIFGRGGEEIQQLAEHRIPFQVVPGITAASGCAAYSGIPLTHRDHAQSVRFVTGHLKDGSINLPWNEFVHGGQTLVFYMGLIGLPTICQQLIKHGRNPATPIALVEKGTTREQKVIISDLENMPDEVSKHDVHAPTLLIVGDVVQLHSQLHWFDPANQG
jgi:uroporphyrin-III C-methyltransferase/precorrin-2 dehydrogenase/sirohydrochlorin ferrochelatase